MYQPETEKEYEERAKGKHPIRVFLEDVMLVFLPSDPKALREWSNLELSLAYLVLILLFAMVGFVSNVA